MKVVIAGSRGFHHNIPRHYEWLEDMIKEYEDEHGKITLVISGRATGPDKLGEMWAKRNNASIAAFPADWDRFGKGAGHIRNNEMGTLGDAAIIMWDGESRGTKHMISVMKQLNKPHIVRILQPVVINEYKQMPNGLIKVKCSDGREWYAPSS